MAEHTKGPWEIASWPDPPLQIWSSPADTGGQFIAYVYARRDVEARANARLIAAAPDLLAAADELLAQLAYYCSPLDLPQEVNDAENRLQAAVAKARAGTRP